MKVAQLSFDYPRPRRARAKKAKRRGRPRKAGRIRHEPRDVHRLRPLHVTLRMRREVWNLRSRRCYSVLERAFYKSVGREDGRVTCFSVQGNHIHMVVEADDREALGRMMQAMCIRMAKGLNRVMNQRRGAVFAERYHSRTLGSPSQTRAALVYVMQNYAKHRAQANEPLPRGWVDLDYSSAVWFDGWADDMPSSSRPAPVSTSKIWLRDRGWWECAGGKISRFEMPAS